MMPLKPPTSALIGAFSLFVGLLIWSSAIWSHPLDNLQSSTATILLISGAGILLREWRKRRRSLAGHGK